MNASWGKVRIGIVGTLSVAALAIVCLHRSSGRAYSAAPVPTLFVTDGFTLVVTAYPATSNGDVSPLAPAPTGLAYPQFAATDASGNLYITNELDATVTVYAAGSNGDAAPIAVIGGPNTGLKFPSGIAVDSSGKIYVADYGSKSAIVYSAGSNGNVAPIATITGSNTGLGNPVGIAVDSSGKIYVANYFDSVVVYSAGSNGNVAPIATISGSNTGLDHPQGIAVDSGGKIYVTDYSAGITDSVFVYSAGSNGNVAPIASISGSNTGLHKPQGIAVDSNGKIYVADVFVVKNSASGSVFVYPAGSNGDVFPSAAISGSNTGLFQPRGIALDPSGNIYAVDTRSVVVYPAGSNGNAAPSAVISTVMTTGLLGPAGIAVDSSGKIYVTDDGSFAAYANGVSVYPAGSNGNAAPIATISGSNTGLISPQAIAVDSGAKST
jgi:DNA-binding beta-propeller fold protein YncE